MENNTEDITLKEIFQNIGSLFLFLKTKLILIITLSIVGSALGLGYSYLKKPIYNAALTFALEEKSVGNASGIGSIASQFGLNLGGSEGGAFAGDNIIELMKSRLLIEKTLLTKVKIDNKETFLINHYIDFKNLRENWSKNPELKQIQFESDKREDFSRAQDSILGAVYTSILNENLSVDKFDKKLSIISVQTNSSDEIFSKLFCENLVKNVADFYIETKVGKLRKNVSILEGRVDSVKTELDLAMFGRATFADQNLGLVRQRAAVPKLKQEMKVQMLGTMYGELVKNLEFSKLSLMREEPLIQIIDTPIYPLKKVVLSKIKGAAYGFSLSILLSVFMLTIIYFIKNTAKIK